METPTGKTKEQYINEIDLLKAKIAEFEKAGKRQKETDERIYFLTSVVEQSFDGMAIANLKGELLFVNDAWARMHGYNNKEELSDKHLSIFHNKEQLAKDVDPFNQIVMEKGFNTGEVGHIRKDGTVFPTQMTSTVLKDANNNAIAITGIVRDITDEKKAEDKLKAFNQQLIASEQQLLATNQQLEASNQQLRAANQQFEASEQQLKATNQQLEASNQQLIASEEKIKESESILRALFNAMTDIVFEMDYDGRYISVAPTSPELMFKPTEDIVGKTLHEVFQKTEADIFLDFIRKCLKENKITTIKYPLVIKDKTVWFEGRATPKTKKSVLYMARDITESKRAEEELIKAKDRAEENDRLKTAFLQNISHEIRSPMNGILGFTNLLLEPGLTGKDQQKYIDVIKKSGDRMLNTINDLMDISMIESNQVKIVNSDVNVNTQIEYLHTFLKPEIKKNGIQFSYRNHLPNEEAHIKTDQEKIYSILMNLIKNAIKFTNKGSIEFGYLKKTLSGSTVLEFFVKDTGIGVPEKWHEAIFDRFVQADLSLSKKYEGSGLGLSISKAYAEMLGGKIWVESREGEGSVFYFTIPYNLSENKENTRDKTGKKTKPEQRSKKILIAEDEEYGDLYLTKLLKAYTDNILHARTGIEAVDIFSSNPDVDIILMDIKMPEMSGYEATKRIREFDKDVVIIAQTAYALAGDREKAIDAGCNDYIPKPIEKDRFNEIIEKYL
jgi:PAS domain S-box-containing protein